MMVACQSIQDQLRYFSLRKDVQTKQFYQVKFDILCEYQNWTGSDVHEFKLSKNSVEDSSAPLLGLHQLSEANPSDPSGIMS